MLKKIPSLNEFLRYTIRFTDESFNIVSLATVDSSINKHHVFKIKQLYLPDRVQLPGKYKVVHYNQKREVTIVRTDVYPLLWIYYWVLLRLERSICIVAIACDRITKLGKYLGWSFVWRTLCEACDYIHFEWKQ